jgi:Plasmid encoded RepA protein
VERSRFHFLHEAKIWYHCRPEQTVLSSEFENVIVLSDEFYEEITAHPIPTDLEAVKVLAGAPAVLDLFLWLSYRCSLATQEEAIPLFGAFGLAQQVGLGRVFAAAPVSRQAPAVTGHHSRPLAGVPGLPE